jgi:tRNA pseudouridine38-40 synthase
MARVSNQWIFLVVVLLAVADRSLSFQSQRSKISDRSSIPLYAAHHEDVDASTLTSAILRVSFDGTKFTGWSAANGQLLDPPSNNKSRRRRRRSRQMRDALEPRNPGYVRSVESVLRENLAKLNGNVDPSRIIVEGCSRTDSGVHGTGMIAQVYCLKENYTIDTQDESDFVPVIPGKRQPHPASPTDDSCFTPLPMHGNLSRIAFSLNRMRPPDVQITGIAPTPETSTVFHASLSSVSKTYHYRISTGHVHDPTLERLVWNAGYSDLNVEEMKRACRLLEGTHDFAAFRGAPRGDADRRRYLTQNTTCTVFSIDIVKQNDPMPNGYFAGIHPPLQLCKVKVTGDRFLYRMVRLMVGAMVAVGRDKLKAEDIAIALETGKWDIPNDGEGRRHQFTCAPAHGLVLHHVDYGEDIQFDWQPLRDG